MKRARDHWGRPTWSTDDWPFVVQAVRPAGSHTILEIVLPASWATSILDALHILSAFVRQIEHHAESAERDRRVSIRLAAWSARKRELQAAYEAARTSGLRHRAALRVLVDARRFSDLGFSCSDLNRLIENPTGRRSLAARRSAIRPPEKRSLACRRARGSVGVTA